MKAMRNAARILSLLSAGLSALLYVRKRPPLGLALWGPKVLAGALAPWLAVLGLAGAVLGAASRAPVAALAGLFGLVASARAVWRVVTSFGDFERAFGPDWQERIRPEQTQGMLRGRWTWNPARPKPARQERDLAFWTLEDGRQLLCDLWQPPEGVPSSGLGMIYLHGSAWYLSDKDLGTRPTFAHLAGQGHVCIDVAYRMCPEVGLKAMVGDVRRAISWLKVHAAEYGVDPERIVLAGGSAGAHLALLAAYTDGHPELTPVELRDADLSVRAVVAYYPPVDMRAIARHDWGTFRGPAPCREDEGAARPVRRDSPEWPAYQAAQMRRMANLPDDLLGGSPEEVPEMYDLASPLSQVHPGCPPTLLLQGADDVLVSAERVRALYERLLEASVPAVYLELPHTEHGFDLVLPWLSPPAQAALHEVERFLAVVNS